MKKLCFDAATHTTGWAFFDDEKLVDYGTLEQKGTDSNVRVNQMANQIARLIAGYNPDLILLEDVQVESNSACALLLAKLQGAIRYVCYMDCIPINVVPPTTWRKRLGFVGGAGVKRKQLKQLSMDYVFDKLGIKTNDDVADAICLGLANSF